MAKAKKKAERKQGGGLKAMGKQFVADAAELWQRHEALLARKLEEEAKDRKMTVSFSAALDLSGSKAKLKTAMSFGRPVTDSLEHEFDDPDQLFMPEVLEQSARGKKGAKLPDASGNGHGPEPKDAA